MKRYEIYAAMLPRVWLALALFHIPRPPQQPSALGAPRAPVAPGERHQAGGQQK
jgi:hypothetical protein